MKNDTLDSYRSNVEQNKHDLGGRRHTGSPASFLRLLQALLRASVNDSILFHPRIYEALQGIYFYVLPANGYKPKNENSLAVPLNHQHLGMVVGDLRNC